MDGRDRMTHGPSEGGGDGPARRLSIQSTSFPESTAIAHVHTLPVKYHASLTWRLNICHLLSLADQTTCCALPSTRTRCAPPKAGSHHPVTLCACQAEVLSTSSGLHSSSVLIDSRRLAARFQGQIPSKLGPLFRPPTRYPFSGRRGLKKLSPPLTMRGGAKRRGGVACCW